MCGHGRDTHLKVYQQQQKVGGRQDVVECVPLQLREEEVDVERVAHVVQDSRRELKDPHIQFKVPSVPPHDHQRWQEGHVGDHLEAEGDAQLRRQSADELVVSTGEA